MRETLNVARHEHLPGATRLAVRSSALDEDGRYASRAGLYTSVLNVSPDALSIDAHFAGIAAVYRDTVEVESVAGLAVGLVDGTAEPEHHRFTLPLETPRLPHEHAAHAVSHLGSTVVF